MEGSEVSSRSIFGAAVCAVAIPAILFGGLPAAAQDFYSGKTVTVIVSGGGTYETYGRLFARHLPKYIPGRPTMIVQSMPGGGGIRAANFLYKIAPRDGTYIGGVHGAVLTAPFLSPSPVEFDVTRFSWLGNATRDTSSVMFGTPPQCSRSRKCGRDSSSSAELAWGATASTLRFS
jgi:tripartite-type tricarboxylate transporter receptor subunit TctC